MAKYLSQAEMKWIDAGFLGPLQERLEALFGQWRFETVVVPRSEHLRVILNRQLKDIFHAEFERFFPYDYPFRGMLEQLLEPWLKDTGNFDWQITNQLGELGKTEDPLKVICRPDNDPSSWTSQLAAQYALGQQNNPVSKREVHVLVPTGLDILKMV